ncbi:MAG: Holliday junction branch migration protein RuvA [Dethiosulfovibrio peptidovorans]|nr:MAG: Holliday junction branch migration protein RuvA [Dethiosulfovibrio peptidovorans]
MLARIRGTVVDETISGAIVDVAGLGFEIQLSRKAGALCSLGAQVELHCHVQFAETGPSLFGFADGLEKAVFLRLLSVRGIGGKLAMQVLQGMAAESVVQAVTLGDPAALTSVPGIGKKTAERICFELQEKMTRGLPETVERGDSRAVIPDRETVLEALESLGFSRQASVQAMAVVAEHRSLEGLGVEELIMIALKHLSSHGAEGR